MDPQVAETWGSATWLADAYSEVLAEFMACGDELGLHTHPYRWEEETGDWFSDFEDEAWGVHCVTASTEAFRAAFDRPCRSHRGGDHFLTGAMLGELDRSGIRVDLTIEPGWPPGELEKAHGRSRGLLPDFRGVPRHPYHSSPEKFPANDPNANGPLLIPLFSPPARSAGHRLPLWPARGKFVPRLALEMLASPPSVLALIEHTGAALSRWDRIQANLVHLSRHRGVRFVTASRRRPTCSKRREPNPSNHKSHSRNGAGPRSGRDRGDARHPQAVGRSSRSRISNSPGEARGPARRWGCCGAREGES